jgi:hypothetical protein
MRPEITAIVLAVLAIVFAILAYVKDPGLSWIGARNGLAFPVLAGWLVKVFYQE